MLPDGYYVVNMYTQVEKKKGSTSIECSSQELDQSSTKELSGETETNLEKEKFY